jgi:hypothetical protein
MTPAMSARVMANAPITDVLARLSRSATAPAEAGQSISLLMFISP